MVMTTPVRNARVDPDLIAMGVVLGCAGGLFEGIAHMALQKLNVLENVWYPIIWIAAVQNGVLVTVFAILLSVAVSRFRDPRRPRNVAIFLITFAAVLPGIAWALKEWIRAYSILILALAVSAVVTRWIAGHEPTARRLFRGSVRGVLSLTLLTFVAIDGGAWAREQIATSRLVSADAAAPNILLVVIDALRADHLSSYGYSRQSSPAIDRLAAEGALFEQAFSTSSYTLPSHASLVTGQYPYQNGVEWGNSHHWSHHVTLAELLEARGYRTGAFSGNTYWFSREHGFGQGFLHFEDFFHSIADRMLRTAYGRLLYTKVLSQFGYEDIPARKHATDTNAAVLRWLARDDGHPFFVMINYMDVHDPYLPPQPYRSRFSTQPAPGGLINWELHVPESLTPDQLQSEIDAYDGAIAYVDDQIGALVAAMRRQHQDRPLLVVVTSDHGEEFAEHGGFLHGGHLYREAIHVPLVVWLPGRVPAGTRVSRPVSNASIPATILDLIGAAPAPPLAPSLKRLWTDDHADQDWAFPLSELMQRPWEEERMPVHDGSMRSVVAPSLHFIDHTKFGPQLFDWVSDPRETRDLAKQPDMQPAVERFRNELPAGGRAAHGR
jgi:arylsulfatase A-like enzyme